MNRLYSLLILIALTSLALVGCGPAQPPAEEIADATFGANEAPLSLSPQQYVEDVRGEGIDHLLIDVREPWEFQDGHIEGAINIPLGQLESRISELPGDVPLVLYCRSGNRSGQAASILQRNGVTGVYNMGGTIDWTGAGYPLQ